MNPYDLISYDLQDIGKSSNMYNKYIKLTVKSQ